MGEKFRILCVDDEMPNLALLEAVLAPKGYDVIIAASGQEALAVIEEKIVHLILLDIMMPGLDGYTVCKMIKEDERTKHIPVIVITCLTSREERIKAIQAGADDFVCKPFDQTELLVRIAMLLKIQEDEDAFAYVIHSLARAAETRDEDTGNHILRVGEYCAIISKKMGMSEKFCDTIRLQAALHDVGKIHMQDFIFKKGSNLTSGEWDEIKKHPFYGARIIGEHPRMVMAKTIAMTHHERWDGSGYPYGLKGQDIPIEGRITLLSDQYDALRNPRVYKPAFDHRKTYTIITEGDGRTEPGHFDPEVLDAFRKTDSLFEDLYGRMEE